MKLTDPTVANTPAEITHLLEEIQAKDAQIMAYKDEITKRDMALQKWVRVNGGHVQNPKEEAFSKTINDCYDKCEILQAEKCGLSEKALIVLERQIKRLDVGLRSLSVREEFPADWNGPSLLSGSATGVSTPVAGGPLQAISGNVGASGAGGPNIANAAQLRMAQSSAASRSVGGTTTPASAPRSQRESSSEASKRRRLNQSLGSLPTPASHLRQSSLGPSGTPKAGTPGPTTSSSSRQGSAQPSRPPTKKANPPTLTTARKPIPSSTSKDSRKRARLAATTKKRRDTSSLSATPSPSPARDEEEGEDTTLYCFCQKVSFGDMVGCDNDDCKYQWFHWGCVGLRSEPAGEWLCPECRKGKEG